MVFFTALYFVIAIKFNHVVISGTITDARTGAPIKNINVGMSWFSNKIPSDNAFAIFIPSNVSYDFPSARSDELGRYTLSFDWKEKFNAGGEFNICLGYKRADGSRTNCYIGDNIKRIFGTRGTHIVDFELKDMP